MEVRVKRDIILQTQVDCLTTSTCKVYDENKIHITNDYYCNFVLVEESEAESEMHILIGAHRSSVVAVKM